MIIESNDKLTSTGDSKYKIEISGKTFRSLFGDLYANPLQSMIREIVANAHDANRRAGYNGPVEIEINNDNSDHYIEVKDHGIGMTYEDMVNIYTTFFRSTKDNSNEDIGGFGIGSKSPLAYADYFIAISIKDGKKNVIITSKNNDIPSYEVMLKDHPTDEENGTVIRIPIKESDKGTIVSYCRDDLMGFDPMPIVTAYGKTVKMYEVYEIVEGLRIVDNNMLYPVQYVSVGGPIYRESISSVPFSGAIILDMPIADVKLSLSRESISRDNEYHKAFKKIADDKFNKALEKIKGMSREEIIAAPWVKHILFSSYSKDAFLTVLEKLDLYKLKEFTYYFSKDGNSRSRGLCLVCNRQKDDSSFCSMMGIHFRGIMDSEYLNFAREELYRDNNLVVPISCLYNGVTFFTDLPEEELIEFAQGLGKKCRILDKDSPQVKKHYASLVKNRDDSTLTIKFSNGYFYSSNGSQQLEYKVEDIKDDDLFVVGSNNIAINKFQEMFNELKLVFPNRNLYVGRGTPIGFTDAKACLLPNVVTFTKGEMDDIARNSFLGIMNAEERENALKYIKGLLLSKINKDTSLFDSSSFLIESSLGRTICKPHSLYGFYNLEMRAVMEKVTIDICKSGEHIETKEKNSPLALLGHYLLCNKLEEELISRYPLWREPGKVMMYYIERMDKERELQCSR